MAKATNTTQVEHGSCQDCGQHIGAVILHGELWLCLSCYALALCEDNRAQEDTKLNQRGKKS